MQMCVSVAQSQQDERLALLAEWYDDTAALLRKFTFFFYPGDATIEMVVYQPDVTTEMVLSLWCSFQTGT